MATTITANGINFPDGSAGSPSIGGSDTNTGLFTGSDIVGFATGGSERLKIDASGNVNIANDSGKLQLGASADLQIFHNGTNNYIDSLGSAIFYNRPNADWYVSDYSSNENRIKAIKDGSVELYHNGTLRAYTTNVGLHVDNLVSVPDNGKFRCGNGDDLEIYHDGSNSFIQDSGTGVLVVNTNQLHINNAANNENMLKATENGAVELFYDNSKKLSTTSGGIEVSGGANFTSGNVSLLDNSKIKLGTGDDLQIYHDGSNSFIKDAGTGELRLEADAGGVRIQRSNGNTGLFYNVGGTIELYYDNTLSLATIDKGIKLHSGGFSQLKFFDVNTSTISMYTNSVDLRWYDDVNNDNIMQLSQNGDLNIDGSYSNSGVDYAEYFESTDGSAIAIGTTVVLEDGKVRAATSSETPIGVIRPKTSGTSVTGGVNQLNWQGKYLVDDYDGQVIESAVHCTWVDDDKKDQQCWKDRPPTGVTIPSDAVETTRERPKLNPLFDESKTYVPRSERDEWNCVGLLGQIPITKGQPTSSSWIKMKDKNSTVELWMVK